MASPSTFGLTDYPTMAAPWASADQGETWVWGEYFAIFQTKPPTVFEMMTKIAGVPRQKSGMTYAYAMTVFYRRDRNPSACPVISVGLEQADYDAAASRGAPLLPGMPKTGKGAMFIGMFTAQGHLNFGQYDGPLDPKSVRNRLLREVGTYLQLAGTPNLIGAIADAYGHALTGVPAQHKSKANTKKGCLGAIGLVVGFVGIALAVSTKWVG